MKTMRSYSRCPRMFSAGSLSLAAMIRRTFILGLALCGALSWAGAAEAPKREPLTGVLGALVMEVDLLAGKLKDAKEHEFSGVPFITGTLAGRKVVIACSGSGKVHATMATALLLDHFKPTELLFTGVGGAINPELDRGDIVIGEKLAHHDFGDLTPEGFTPKGAGRSPGGVRPPLFIPASPALLKLAEAAGKGLTFGKVPAANGERAPVIRRGVIVAGDVFVASVAKKAELRKQFNADAVEMEGAAVAQVCWHQRVPCLVIRSISDKADASAALDFVTFAGVAAENSAKLTVAIVEQLAKLPSASPALVPAPAKMTVGEGTFALTRATSIAAGPGAETEAQKLAAVLRTPTGLPLPFASKEPKPGAIILQLDRSLEPQLGTEGYRLSVTPARVTICAAAEAGLFYGSETFRQLLPPQVFAAKRVARAPDGGWVAPCVEIEDRPRFAWRGLMLDPVGHFVPLEFIKKFVDVMALHKMNTLHLHLTDDAGWRIEIKKHPQLTQLGSVRKESPMHGDRNRGDGQRYGPFFYTQRQIRDLVAYARARHVTLVPEIDMPGHCLAALVVYPKLSCRGGPFEVRTRWGIDPDILCPGNDAALAFVKDVLGEVCELFPSRFIHIGGDEAPRDRWKSCAKCRARLRAEGLTGEAQLQTWFNHRVEEFLASKGRQLIGWDEILEGGLTPGAAVMSWRGIKGGIAAASAGHDVVMAPTSHCYFDYAQSKSPGEPECGGFIPLSRVYEFEPVPAELPESKRRHILGAQGTLWSEYMWTPRDVEYFAFPRASALAEVVWTPAERKDFADFERRLQGHLLRLDHVGVNYRKPSAADDKK